MSVIDRYKNLLTDLDDSIEYWAEGAVLDFTEELARIMENSGISRAELAKRVGTSPAYITKVFGGQANFTVETMTKLALAVDHVLRIHVAAKDVRTRWIDIRESDGLRFTESTDNVVDFAIGGPDQSVLLPAFKWTEGAGNNG